MSLEYRIVAVNSDHVGFVASERGLKRVYLPGPSPEGLRRQILREFPDATESPRLLPKLAAAIGHYFRGQPVEFDVDLDLRGHADFHVDVWSVCRRVRYGTTGSYKSLAERAGRPGAARAVGNAMRKNPCPLVVPCHRVLKSDGSLGGYSGTGGLALKQRLLDMEAAASDRG